MMKRMKTAVDELGELAEKLKKKCGLETVRSLYISSVAMSICVSISVFCVFIYVLSDISLTEGRQRGYGFNKNAITRTKWSSCEGKFGSSTENTKACHTTSNLDFELQPLPCLQLSC